MSQNLWQVMLKSEVIKIHKYWGKMEEILWCVTYMVIVIQRTTIWISVAVEVWRFIYVTQFLTRFQKLKITAINNVIVQVAPSCESNPPPPLPLSLWTEFLLSHPALLYFPLFLRGGGLRKILSKEIHGVWIKIYAVTYHYTSEYGMLQILAFTGGACKIGKNREHKPHLLIFHTCFRPYHSFSMHLIKDKKRNKK